MRKLWILAAVAALSVPVAGATVIYPNAIFVDSTGIYQASFSIDHVCAGAALLTVEIHWPSGLRTYEVGVTNTVAPDPCIVDCSFCCPIPFSWTITSPDATQVKGKQRVALEGAGATNPLSWELSGVFLHGALYTRHLPGWLPGPAV